MLINMAIYAAILALMLVCLSFRTASMRRTKHIAMGDGDDVPLRQAIRAQGNFTEYTPIFLILLAVLELNQGMPLLIHLLGIVFIIGRCLHAYGLIKAERYENGRPTAFPRYRVAGMLLTLGSIVIAALAIAVMALIAL